MSYGKDRRVAKRISYICEVQCDGSGVSRLATRINDLSLTGAFIDSVTCYPQGTILTLKFHIKDVLIETTAEVRYSMQRMGMGLHFLDLQPDHVAALESLIEGKPMPVAPSTSETTYDSDPKLEGSNIPDVLLGNFAVVNMFDVIQIIENNRLVGTLAVGSPGGKGEIYFNDGQIVGANSGSNTGTEALKSFLGVTEGSFEFKRTNREYPDNIGATSNMQLMMDLLREKDEETAALT
jgi:uncharacterized protein DUF4388/PilZ domain-containing protein